MHEGTVTQEFEIPVSQIKIKEKNKEKETVRETTNAEADEVLSTLLELLETQKEFPVEVGFKIAQNIKSLEDVVGVYRTEAERIIKNYSKDGKTVKKEEDPEKFEECRDKLERLGKIKISVQINEISMDDLKGMKLSIKQIFALAFITKGV